jgi:small GTP-binding protein
MSLEREEYLVFDDEDYQQLFKIVLLGDNNVGKTNLINRYCSDTFKEEKRSTYSTEFGHKIVSSNFSKASRVKLQIWDTSGQMSFFSANASGHVRGALGYILVCDLTNRQSFKNLTEWAKKIQSEEASILIVGTHSDQEDLREVTTQELNDFTDTLNNSMRAKGEKHVCIGAIEVSSKDSTNVEEAFIKITTSILKRLNTPAENSHPQKQSNTEIDDLKAEIQKHFGLKGSYTGKWFKHEKRKTLLIDIDNLLKCNNINEILVKLKGAGDAAQQHHQFVSGWRNAITGELINPVCRFQKSVDEITSKFDKQSKLESNETSVLLQRKN